MDDQGSFPVLFAGGRRPPGPARPASLALWLEARPGRVWQDAAATAAAGTGDRVRAVTAPRAGLPGRAQAGDATLRPALTAAGVACDGTTGMGLTGAAVALPGPLTAYAALRRLNNAKAAIPFGGVAGGASYSFLAVYSDGNVYFQADDPDGSGHFVSAPYTGSDGDVLCRWRRAADGKVYFAATGMAEVLLGTRAGTVTLDALGERSADTLASDAAYRVLLLYTADLVESGGDALTRAYLASRGEPRL